jgi:WD40 repeat protein
MLMLRGHTAPVQTVAFTTDGQALTAADGSTVLAWDLTTGQSRPLPLAFQPLRMPWAGATVLALSPNGEYLAWMAYAGPIRVIHLPTLEDDLVRGKNEPGFRWLTGPGRFVFSADGTRLAGIGVQHFSSRVYCWHEGSSPLTRKASRWECARQEWVDLRGQSPFGETPAVAFSPADPLLLAVSTSNCVRILDAKDGRQLCLCTHPPRTKIRAVVFSPDGRALATAAGPRVRLWDPDDGAELASLKGHDHYVTCLSFSPDGRLLLSGGRDRQVRLWEVDTGRALARYQWGIGTPRVLAFAPGGMTAVVAGETTTGLLLFDVDESPR